MPVFPMFYGGDPTVQQSLDGYEAPVDAEHCRHQALTGEVETHPLLVIVLRKKHGNLYTSLLIGRMRSVSDRIFAKSLHLVIVAMNWRLSERLSMLQGWQCISKQREGWRRCAIVSSEIIF
jgi:hypothetical protein